MGFFSRSKTSGARRPQAAQRPSTAHQSVLSRQRVRRGGAGRNVRIERGPQAEVQDRPASKKGMAGAFLDRYFAGYDWARFRITLVFCFFGVLFLCLWARAWYLQMMAGPDLAAKARRQHITSEIVSGKRGMILDRNGRVLARSVEALSVYAKPAEITDFLTVANTLGPLLGEAPQQLFDELSKTRRRFVWLKRKVDDYTAEAVRKVHLQGIGLSKEYERVYPFKQMAGQLLGFVGMDDRGLEGLERSLDARLGSKATRQIVQRDAMGRKFYMKEEGQEDPQGEDVTLTIDVQMQFFAEEAISRAVREADARWGGALVVHVPTGEILAWAQYPFFNPNTYHQSRPQIYRNRLAQDAMEPGSTFKPFVMAAAMQERKVNRNTVIDCEGGRWQTKYVTIRDTSHHGAVTADKVIRYSSNIGMAKIGLMLGTQKVYRYLHELGFGERTCVPVSESRGILRPPRDWSEVDTMSASFGQSVSVTGLQMVQAYMTLLSGGMTKPLRLVMDDPLPETRKQIFSEPVTREVKRMMNEVVEEKDGTGRKAHIDGISVAGKTGTAQKADRRAGAYGAKRLASFVGFLPADNPAYLILVLIDEPQRGRFGGIIAAPAFKEIGQRVMAYAGGLPGAKDKPLQVADLEEEKTAPKERSRGFRASPAESPFERREEDVRRQRLAQLIARQDSGDAMRLPGHLAKASATVPDVQGKTLRNAVELFARAGIVPILKGEGTRVVRQSPPPGTPWTAEDAKDAKKQEYVLWLSEN
jgi:cell division protein FtsI (penicillin-binding protein 3)